MHLLTAQSLLPLIDASPIALFIAVLTSKSTEATLINDDLGMSAKLARARVQEQ